ncbi:hypothetical protein [Ligilactobacillus salivarius]|uniref:hypothetical protein n=1 Tax=Ligilactobacillus salivarius TaxID=1624 RepID=UPI00202361AB|nr:hypothetical protein [Ligilactobacillus salivarius]URI13687.1 hypothetical protein M9Y03_08410 [Ligilactobacillus salivarius]UUB35513.1 hypothetical protein NO469_08460 [Ligilactobacillus salivarius]
MKVKYKLVALAVIGLGTFSMSNVSGNEVNKANIPNENVNNGPTNTITDKNNEMNIESSNKVNEENDTNIIKDNTQITEKPVYESQNVALNNQGKELPKEVLNDMKENASSTI